MPLPSQSPPRECLELLDNAVSQLQMDRPSHARCQLAVRTLEQIIVEYDAMKAVQRVADLASADGEPETTAEAE